MYRGAPASPSPTPADTARPPSVTAAGVLGDGAHLLVTTAGILVALSPNFAEQTADGGKTWTTLRPPSNGAGIVIDPANSRHALTGGSTIQVTTDAGASWQRTRTSPPGTGPYQPLQISPFDSTVWFLIHQNRLLRTRDASISWRDLTGLPALDSPVMVPGQAVGEFFLATGNRVFHLVDNGQGIGEEPALSQGVRVVDLAVVAGSPPSLLARGSDGAAYLLKGKVWSAAGGGLGGPIAVGGNGTLLVGNGGAKLGEAGAVSYSTDAGITWSPATGLAYDQTVEAIAAQPSSTTYFAYCYGGDIYTSSDGGRAWTLLTKALRTSAG